MNSVYSEPVVKDRSSFLFFALFFDSESASLLFNRKSAILKHRKKSLPPEGEAVGLARLMRRLRIKFAVIQIENR